VKLAEADTEVAAVRDEEPTKKSAERLGIEASNLNSDLANKFGLSVGEKGVVITDVERGGPAYGAGLRPGDVIKRIGKRDIGSMKDFNAAISDIGKGETALFLINRHGTSMFIAFNVPN